MELLYKFGYSFFDFILLLFYVFIFCKKKTLQNELNLKVIKFEIRFLISFINFMITYDFFEGNTLISLILLILLFIINLHSNRIWKEDLIR